MKILRKRILALVLAFAMLLTGVPMEIVQEAKAADVSDFTLDFTQNITGLSGVNLTADSVGEGWKVATLGGGSNSVSAGDFVELGATSNFNLTPAFAFTAPAAGAYNLAIGVQETNGTCNADVYVNDVYVGTIKTNKNETVDNGHVLLGVNLKDGAYANTIKFVTQKASVGNGKGLFRLISLNFTAPTVSAPRATIAFDATAEATTLNAGETTSISATGFVPTNGTFFDAAKSNFSFSYESNPAGVVTVDNGTVTAIASGNTTVTVKAVDKDGNVFGTDTIDFVVAGAGAPVGTPIPTDAPTEQPTATPIPSTDAFTLDFGMPTQGLSGVDVTSTGGMVATGISGTAATYTVSTSLAGTNWSLNADKTTIAKSDNTTYVFDAGSGVLYHKAKAGNTSSYFSDSGIIAIRLGCNQTMVFNFEVETAGLYEMQVLNVKSNKNGDVTVNPGGAYEETFTGLIEPASNETKTSPQQVILTEGTNTIAFLGTDASSYIGFRAVEFKRVGDISAVPTPAPTPAPTPLPTLAPTATPMPTEDPNAVKEPFEVNIATLDKETAYTTNDKDYYFTKSSVGSNWAVHTSDETVTASGYSTNGTARIYTSAGTPNRVTLYKMDKDNVLSFTAPASGTYDLSAIMYYNAAGGYADIFVNDTYVGTVDSSKPTGVNDQKLLGVYLNGGTLANKIAIRPTGPSNGSGNKTYWTGFSFTTPESIATLTGLEIVTETTSMFVDDTQTIAANGALTNGGLYRFASAGQAVAYESSDATVATVTSAGVVKALKAGSTTITVSVPALGYTDTVEITVSDVVYDTPEINLTDDQAFTEGDTYTLEAKAKFNSGKYADANKVTVTYESDDEAVAKVEGGVLYALTPGKAKITAHVEYEGVTLDVTKKIEVEAYIPPTAFEVNFKGVKNTIISNDYHYISKDTYGTNWTVSSKTTCQLATNEDNPGHARIFKDTKDYVTLYKKGTSFVYDVDVKTAGKYDITADMVRHTKGGYATVYVNDIYVGTVNTYAREDDTSNINKQPLLGVELKKGSNTIEVHVVGPSQGSGYYAKFAGFTFTTPNEIATISAIEASADVDNMYVGRKEQINVEAILSNGGFYEYAYSDETFTYVSSKPSVATVSNKGLITGVAAGETTITVTANKSGLTDTITFTVSDAAYEKAVMNIAEGEEFYVTNERTLEVVATLADGTIISQNDLTITYTSSNPSVAKVENGVLKAVAKGTATITADAKFTVDGTTKTDVKNIVVTTIPLKTVTGKTEKPVVQELDTNGVQFIVQGIAEDDTLVEDLVVAGFTSFDFAYESLNPEILTIDENGICRYVSRGIAKIKVKAYIDGVYFEDEVEVVSSSGKRGRTLYTDEMVANARYNVQNYKWGVKTVAKLGGSTYSRYVHPFETLYDMIPYEGIPRSFENSTRDVSNEIKFCCPSCGINVETEYGGVWSYNTIEDPWKIWCPNCKTKYPTNDFALLYERGLDENGVYNRELAYQRNQEAVARGEKDALVNELYPEKGATWMVDDGFGWSPTSGTYGTKDLYQYAPVARYMDYLWRYILGALDGIHEYYIYTGDERYGIAGAILLDRVADVYPSYDITKVSLNYYQSHGSGYSGKILGSIAEESTAEIFLRAYDAFYPAFDDPQVVEFLSKKAAELGLENPKTNGNLIRENIENGIVREVFDGLYTAKISGNFGYHQTTAAIAAVVLDTQPETDELLVWLRSPSTIGKAAAVDPIFGKTYSTRAYNTGGEMAIKYVNEIDRDGFGIEVSIAYNQVWIKGFKIAEILSNYGTEILDLYKDPKFVNMLESFIHMTVGDGYSLQFGDGGDASSGKLDAQFTDDIISAYKFTRDPRLAQLYDFYVGGDYNNDKMGYFNNTKELTLAIQEDVAKYGKFDFESLNLTGYGLGIVRGGKLVDGYETRYDTWMYYGRTTGSHAHRDMLALGIDAYGFNFMPDLGAPAFKGASSERIEWISGSLSHNTVTVDETSQLGIYTGTPLHFDATDNVKLIDTEAPKAYEQTDIYRRTAVTIAANDDVSYTLDFFRVKGGNQHTYSFHSSSYEHYFTDDIELTPQVNEKGEYAGTYAGIDVPYGPDPNSTDSQASEEPMYPRGYTWLERVKRGVDKTGDGIFTIKFEQTDFKDQVNLSAGLAVKVHAINDWTPNSVDLAVGHPGAKLTNENIPGYDYLLIQRKGENLDTLFTTLIEPFRVNDYILKAEPIATTIKAGTEGADDIVKAVRVTLKNGRTDYVIYATNNDVTYNVTDGNVSFDFAGFVGVYTVDAHGENIYSYANDGTIIGDKTYVGAYTGTVVDFTKEYVMDDYIIIKTDQEVEDVSIFENQYIYIDNEGAKCNGAFRILSAEKQGENISLYLGNTSLIERYVDDYDLDAGFIYTIADGQEFYIPMSTSEGDAFTGTDKPSGSGGSSSTPAEDVTTSEETSDSLLEVEEEMLYGETDTTVNDDDVVVDDKTDEKDDASTTTETQSGTEGGNGEPTATPDATGANAGGKKVRNILLGGLGVLALGAGIFLILLGKKKDDEEEE